MTNLLDDLKADIDATFTGTLRAGTLYREVEILDEFGNPIGGGWESVGTFEGIRGSFDSVLASVAGIPRTDGKIEILASSATEKPKRTDKLKIENSWWLITEIELDPAGAWYICQCTASSSP